jgi:hypothetical protein
MEQGVEDKTHSTLYSWTLSSGTLMDSALTSLNLHQEKEALCSHFMSVGNTLILHKVLSWQIMFCVGMNTLLVKGQTVELQCWLWTISSLVGLFLEMLIADTVPRASHFHRWPSGVWITGCETNGALVEIFLLSHLQSGYGNWSVNWLHLSYTQGNIYPEAYCHHHKISWRIHLKNLISL